MKEKRLGGPWWDKDGNYHPTTQIVPNIKKDDMRKDISVSDILEILRTANAFKVLENTNKIVFPSDPTEHINMMANLIWNELNNKD